ncbi:MULTISPECIES: hypothetical protein [Burkholderia]|uniref:hypothetical protein n=1 Tax=Burkholderia TaxID=32008 RepID=UPI00129600B3|nr:MULTISPECIES: hypothetical protein [Burkholderia]QGA37231.1 hypothetical protein GAS19_05830 [Burkholderia glumae]
MSNGRYASEWGAAVERSKRFGLQVPVHEVEQGTRYLTDDRAREFADVVQQGVGDLEYSDIVVQCLAIHYRLAPILEKWLGCPVLYTLGWVDDDTPRGMFKFDDALIADKLKNGHTPGSINIHAWLTLPSMEVIDLALVTTLAVVQGRKQGHGAVIAKHADDVTGMTYKPMLVGADFLRQAGLLRAWNVYTF